jgi:hypothetical protein
MRSGEMKGRNDVDPVFNGKNVCDAAGPTFSDHIGDQSGSAGPSGLWPT